MIVVTPGTADLAVMAVNLMDPRRREVVLETSGPRLPHSGAGGRPGASGVIRRVSKGISSAEAT
ncbi:MAG TPA: hypothetical protein VIJ82_00820 [Streptosporangiaceae bacterium]